MKLRFHRELLEDSLKTMVEVVDYQDLVDAVKKEYPTLDIKEVKVEKDSIWDVRIMWETHLVSVRLSFMGSFMAIGHINGYLSKKKPFDPYVDNPIDWQSDDHEKRFHKPK